jgi:transcriptional regulator with XRE-family HTH domain
MRGEKFMEIGELDLFVGKKLRTFRSKFKWPLKTLAEEIGISLQQLQRYELGENKISASMLHKIAGIFNVKIDVFFAGFEKQISDQSAKKSLINLLIIEDNADDEFMIRKALSPFNKSLNIYLLHCVDQTFEFCRKLEFECNSLFPKPHLIFIDLCMSERIEILSYIRKSSTLKDIPVVVFTNNLNCAETKELYKLNTCGIIKKSLDHTELKAQLLRTLNYWLDTVVLH